MAKVRVRRDSRGIYIRHGDEKARPIINSEYGHLGGDANIFRVLFELRNNMWICYDNRSHFTSGDTVNKRHVSQTTRIVVSGVVDGEPIKEMWFLEIV